MEPRPNRRGNKQEGFPQTEAHDPLQWSHVLTDVETDAGLMEVRREGGRFNGATSNRRGNEKNEEKF